MSSIIKTFTNKTSTSLVGKEGYLVKYDTSGVNVCSAITDVPVGVVVQGGATESDVCVFGECLAIAGGAVTAGTHITSHTDGTAIVSAGASCQDCGVALETGVAGNWCQVVFIPVAKTHS